jgi:uncharacterized peroxidase-related enzyme
MSFIQTVEPEQAKGAVADLYTRLQDRMGYLPNYARVFCHRPEVMEPLSRLQENITAHMDPRLWALVSMAVAREINSSYCSLAYARRLLARYFSESELLGILIGSEQAPITAGERAAMHVAVKLARDSSTVCQSDIDQLRNEGFTDAEIFDLVAAAGYRCFFAKVTDALGARPDAALGEMGDTLLENLVVGRDIDTVQHTQSHAGIAALSSD